MVVSYRNCVGIALPLLNDGFAGCKSKRCDGRIKRLDIRRNAIGIDHGRLGVLVAHLATLDTG